MHSSPSLLIRSELFFLRSQARLAVTLTYSLYHSSKAAHCGLKGQQFPNWFRIAKNLACFASLWYNFNWQIDNVVYTTLKLGTRTVGTFQKTSFWEALLWAYSGGCGRACWTLWGFISTPQPRLEQINRSTSYKNRIWVQFSDWGSRRWVENSP